MRLGDISLGRKLAGGFGLLLALLLVLSLAAYATTRGNVQASDLVAHTLRVIALAESTQASLADMETGYRGFLLTGQEFFLDPYRDGQAAVERDLRDLQVETADNPPQVARWQDVAARVADWQANVTEPRIALRRQVPSGAQPQDELVSVVSNGEGRRQFEEMRGVMDAGIAAEQSLLQQRLARADAANQALFTTLIVGTLVAIVFGVAAATLLTRDITSAVARVASAATAIAGGDLARRIRLDRRDEIGQAANAFDHMADWLQTTVLELEESSAELRRNQVELERSNRELQDFASVASHDLQEPLRKIRAFGDRLVVKHGPDLPEQAQDYLARMQDAAARMQTLINDLLTFSRVTTRAQPFTSVDLNSIAADVTRDLEIRIQETGARVEIDPLPTIQADPTQMRQLLQNLLSNALKFHAPDVAPVIHVSSARLDDDRITLTVADNGIGFEEKYLDRIFTIFQRLHGRGEYEGTGVGLAVCRKIVERHGGTITAHSTPGAGATFEVVLPSNEPEPEPRPTTSDEVTEDARQLQGVA